MLVHNFEGDDRRQGSVLTRWLAAISTVCGLAYGGFYLYYFASAASDYIAVFPLTLITFLFLGGGLWYLRPLLFRLMQALGIARNLCSLSRVGIFLFLLLSILGLLWGFSYSDSPTRCCDFGCNQH
jgi:hypothetical protein